MAPLLAPMEWVSALSTRPSLEAAVQAVTAQAQGQLTGVPDLALVFISSAFVSEVPRLLPLLQEALGTVPLVGCSGEGVVGVAPEGSPEEVENGPGLSLCLARLPGVRVQTFHLKPDDLPDLDSPPDAWVEAIGVDPDQNPQFILLADPFSFGTNDLLQGLDFAYPQAVKIGGLAGGSGLQRQGGLFCDRALYREGVVGVALSGAVVLEAIVAQGCRPIGPSYEVAAAERNILLKLEDLETGKTNTALASLRALVDTLSEADRQLAQHSLFIGMAQDSFKGVLGPGDFLIRNLLGVDPRVGAIAMGDRIRPGQRVQFHLRDAAAATADLDSLLQRYVQQHPSPQAQPVGALMFACLGRGQSLYETPHFDCRRLQHHLGPLPLGGFFCNGEIGPVGGTTFLHGYTSVFGLCRQPHDQA